MMLMWGVFAVLYGFFLWGNTDTFFVGGENSKIKNQDTVHVFSGSKQLPLSISLFEENHVESKTQEQYPELKNQSIIEKFDGVDRSGLLMSELGTEIFSDGSGDSPESLSSTFSPDAQTGVSYEEVIFIDEFAWED